MTCGECKHFDEPPESAKPLSKWGLCKAPIPKWLQDITDDRFVRRDAPADDCPCFERKEEK